MVHHNSFQRFIVSLSLLFLQVVSLAVGPIFFNETFDNRPALVGQYLDLEDADSRNEYV